MYGTPMTQPIDKDDVLSVYSGTPGCCCGCRGKHSYRESAVARAVASKRRGYKIQDDECSERNVTRVVNKINTNLNQSWDGGNHWYFETPTRIYIAYKVNENE